MLARVAARYVDLKIELCADNRGQCVAAQIGFARANGDYVVFLDADDYLLPNALKIHIAAHLSAPQARGFTSGDMVQARDNSVVVGTYLNASYRDRRYGVKKLDANTLRDIRVIGTSFDDFFRELDHVPDKIFSVSQTNAHWVWSPMSGNMYRADLARLFLDNKDLEKLFLHFDSYLNFAVNSFYGSLIVDLPLAVYRVHGKNNFTRALSAAGRIVYSRETDRTSYAAYLALRHISRNFAAFSQATSIRHLQGAIRTLSTQASNRPMKWSGLIERLRTLQHAILRARLAAIARTYEKDPPACLGPRTSQRRD